MRLLTKVILIFIMSSPLLLGNIINVPADIDSIQGGINMTVDGDTVLVQPGTYYEYINFNGKNIVVGSLTLTTGDTSYILQTVIDGNGNWSNKSLVTFENGEESTALLCGFTITGAVTFNRRGGISIEDSSPRLSYLVIKNNIIETPWRLGGFGGGIYFKNSKSILTDLEISDNICMAGGGIYCDSSKITMINVIIKNNEATSLHPDGNAGGGIYIENSSATLINVKVSGNNGGYGPGGGIYCNNSSPSFTNVIINNNSAREGGGIYCNYSSIKFYDVTINNNYADIGGGICFDDNSNPIFNYSSRCNIYNNYSSEVGNDLFSWSDSTISVIVDTFSVMNPTDYYAHPVSKYIFDILNFYVEPVNSNLYVSPNGNNANSGISSSEPLRSVSYALSKILADSLNPRSINIANGLYSRSTTGEDLPLRMRDYVSLIGESKKGVIIDAESFSQVMELYNDKGVTIENVTITGGLANYAAGIVSASSNPHFSNVVITGNRAINSIHGTGQAGGIWFYNDNATLSNVEFSNNHAPSISTIWCRLNSNIVCNNVTITGNTTLHRSWIYCDINSSAKFVNSIIWNNIPGNINYDDVHVFYSNVQGGWPGIGNIDTDPMFVDTANGDYSLQAGSPCIDAGTAFFEFEGDTLINLNPWQYNGTAPDMGAYEFGPPVGIEDESISPITYTLNQNYPNPFNPTTTIEFSIPKSEFVTLKVYNLLGQEVSTLVSDKLTAENYKYDWDASTLASGVYIYKLQAGAFQQVKKMVLIK